MELPSNEPSPEQIESEIDQLLEELDGYTEFYINGTLELRDEWWEIEMEGMTSKERNSARNHLRAFVEALRKMKDKV